MYISSKFKCQLSFNWHLNLIHVCVTQSWILFMIIFRHQWDYILLIYSDISIRGGTRYFYPPKMVQYFSSLPVLLYLQVVLFIQIWKNFMTILYNTLKSGGTKDHFRRVKVPGSLSSTFIFHIRKKIKFFLKPEALKSLYRSPGYKKNQLVICKNYVLQW
jgi:preprotein translocase subunit SecY